jgi:hypothetical protein
VRSSRLTPPAVALVVVVGALAAPSALVGVADGSDHLSPPTTAASEPVITAVVSGPGSGDPGSPVDPVAGTVTDPRSGVIPCAWNAFAATDSDADRYNRITRGIVDVINAIAGGDMVMTLRYYSQGGLLHRWNAVIARFEQHQVADCSQANAPAGVTTGDGRWVGAAPPSAAILLPGTIREATRSITLPAPTISPPNRAAVNLGLWLAVEPVGPIAVRAELGPLWAETTAIEATTSFDPGNGDASVVCAGYGTPIPDSEQSSIEQGPCGYTYTSDTDGEPIAMTITTTWTVTWTLSDGTTGGEPDIEVTSVWPYEVYEIQTIGTDG